MAARSDDEGTSAGRPAKGGDDLFANLPRTRPGSRSEARDRARSRTPRKPSPTEPTQVDPPVIAQADAGETSPPAPSGRAEGPPPAAATGTGEDARGSVEGLAWAGVAAAAEAATLGVKLATRALGAVRGAVERR